MEGFGCHSCKFQQFLESSRFEPDLLFPFCTKERKKKERIWGQSGRDGEGVGVGEVSWGQWPLASKGFSPAPKGLYRRGAPITTFGL